MTDALDKVPDGEFKAQLSRIRELYGQVVSSSQLQREIKGFGGQKGIYKPAGERHALWVRETRGGPYSDQHPRDLPDGSWSYLYSPEGRQGKSDFSLDTNKALIRCKDEGRPVGVFRQAEDIQGKVAYEVLGLAFVQRVEGDHFVLQGEPIDWTADPEPEFTTTTFVPYEMDFPRLSVATRVARDNRFGVVLRRLYRERCGLCNLGFRVKGRVVGLDAAHIIPVEERGVIADVRNGILLCKNHHALFDQFAWTFDEDFHVQVPEDRPFRESAVSNHVLSLSGERLPNLPEDARDLPAQDAIKWRLERFRSAWA
jgi:HNH endonuclease